MNRNLDDDHISLRDLLDRTLIHEHLPQRVLFAMRRSLGLSAVLSLGYLIFATWIPNHVMLRGIYPDGFFTPTGQLVLRGNWCLDVLVSLEPLLIGANLVSLGLVFVIFLSIGLTNGHAPTWLHGLGVLATLTPMGSLLLFGLVLLFWLFVVVFTVASWLLTAYIAIQCGIPIAVAFILGLTRRQRW